MRFRVCLAILAVSFIIPCSAQFTSGTRPETADSNKRYTLSGTVVNSVTGEPIRRALVTLSYQQQLSAMTDSDGRFEFPDLPRAQMSVTAQKPGFFNEMELLAGGQRPKQYNVGPDAQSPVIKLMPEAIISGRIFDPDGLPIPRLLVRAVTQKVVQGRKEWQQGITARTDADGYYRIINLMPGSYFLTAGPGRAQAIVTGADETLDLGYPAVTYPAGATPMKLSAGQQLETNFTVKPEPFYSITGSISGTVPGGNYGVRLISRTPGFRMPIGGSNSDAESGTFNIPRVARGDYILEARGNVQGKDGTEPVQLYGSVVISVRSNLMGIAIPLEPMLTIPVRARVERTRPTPTMNVPRDVPPVQVNVSSADRDRPQAFSAPEDPKDPKSPLVIRHVVPGTYRITLFPTFGDTYVASARFGMDDLLDGEITVSSGNQGAIDIVLRDDPARLTLKVQTESPLEGISVLVIPDRGEPKLTQTTAGPNDSGTQVHGLRPGTYTVLAFQDIGNLEYMNPEALKPYLSRGAKISLTPNQEATVSPELIRRGGE